MILFFVNVISVGFVKWIVVILLVIFKVVLFLLFVINWLVILCVKVLSVLYGIILLCLYFFLLKFWKLLNKLFFLIMIDIFKCFYF